MARTRNIKPGFFQNEILGALPPLTRLLFAGLWCWADRDGRVEDRPTRLKAQILPFDNCNVDKMLSELASGPEPFIVRYCNCKRKYIQITNFERHQNPHVNEQSSVIPAPDMSGANTGQELLTSLSQITNHEVLDTSMVQSTRRTKFVKPTLAEVAAYCSERKNGIDPEAFYAHYESNGWKVGQNPMKCWKSAVVTFEKNAVRFAQKTLLNQDTQAEGLPDDQYVN